MTRKNRLSTDSAELEPRQMLAGGSIGQASIEVVNGEVVSQSSDLQGNGAIQATVNGVEVINMASPGFSGISSVSPSPLDGLFGLPQANAPGVQSGANIARASIEVVNGEVVSQSSDLQGSGSIQATVNGVEVINMVSPGFSGIQPAASPSIAGGSSVGMLFDFMGSQQQVSAPQTAGQIGGTDSGTINSASGQFVVENDQIISQQVETQGNGMITGTINGQPISF